MFLLWKRKSIDVVNTTQNLTKRSREFEGRMNIGRIPYVSTKALARSLILFILSCSINFWSTEILILVHRSFPTIPITCSFLLHAFLRDPTNLLRYSHVLLPSTQEKTQTKTFAVRVFDIQIFLIVQARVLFFCRKRWQLHKIILRQDHKF